MAVKLIRPGKSFLDFIWQTTMKVDAMKQAMYIDFLAFIGDIPLSPRLLRQERMDL